MIQFLVLKWATTTAMHFVKTLGVVGRPKESAEYWKMHRYLLRDGWIAIWKYTSFRFRTVKQKSGARHSITDNRETILDIETFETFKNCFNSLRLLIGLWTSSFFSTRKTWNGNHDCRTWRLSLWPQVKTELSVSVVNSCNSWATGRERDKVYHVITTSYG